MTENAPIPVTEKIAAFVAETREADIPEEMYHHARVAFMDWVAVTLGGKDDPLVDKLISYTDKLGGLPQATIVGRGKMKKNVADAALINGAASHVLDYDDTLVSFLGHPSVTLFPALLALSEWREESGRGFLTAYLIGLQAGAVVGACASLDHYMAGWHATATVALTDIPVAASGLGVVARNIYRSKSGPTGAWYYLGTISDNTTTTYLDDLPSSGLGLEGTNLVNTIYSRLLMYTGNSTYTLPNAIDYFKAYLTIINNNYYYYAPISFDRYAAVCKGRGLWSNGYSIYTAYNKTTREYECFIYNASGVLAERWTESTLSALVMKVNEYSAYISLEAMSDSSVTSGFVAYDLNVSGLIGSAQYYKATLHAGYDGFAKDVLGQSVDIGDFMANIDTGIAGAKYSLDPDFADLVSSAQQIEAFDGGLDYEVMLIPGYSDHPELASKMVNVCESRMYSCCLLDTPSGLSPNAAIQYRTQNLASVGSSYAALYWNYGKVYDPQNDIYVWLPPSVFAVRALAVTDNSATPWAAAAGLRRGLVPEILELEYYPALGDRENLQGVQINPIAKIGNTLAVWGNKTTQPFRSMLSNFNTRRMLISAEKAVYITSQSSLFEPNDKTERTRLMLSIQPVFDTIRQQRGLLAFLIADATTDADSAENIARFRIELQPTPTMEVIYYDVVIKNPAQALSSSSTF